MIKYFLFAFVLCTIHFSMVAQAQDLTSGDAPVEISADNSLEWMQLEKQYVANGNVEVIQGTSKINSDKLVADYRENEKTGATEIWQLTAYDNVRITNGESTAQADKAIYDVNSGVTILTGNDLKLTLPDQVITAQERMDYDMNKGVAKAIGNAKITRGTDTLSAQTITANFVKDAAGKQSLNNATANGGVTIKTPDETITGSNATYNAKNNTAEMLGNVKIARGPNTLEGARAEVNLTNNISKMFGEPQSGTRVKGVFFPSTKPESGVK